MRKTERTFFSLNQCQLQMQHTGLNHSNVIDWYIRLGNSYVKSNLKEIQLACGTDGILQGYIRLHATAKKKLVVTITFIHPA